MSAPEPTLLALSGDEFIDAESFDVDKKQRRQQRFEALGFHPQTEIRTNQLLPYGTAGELDAESQQQLAVIRANLARAVACRELRPSVWLWMDRLGRYIQLYGLKFSLEDHLGFIRVLLSLLEMPFLEPKDMFSTCHLLVKLLKKNKLITPADLQIDWRPIYKLATIYIDVTSSKSKLYRFNTSVENSFIHLIERASFYFPPGSSQQIIDEILPKLMPLIAGNSCETFSMLAMFLGHTADFGVWLEPFIDTWNGYQNPVWNQDIMNMLARVVRNNCGRVDWEPHMAMMYARILRSLKLPVFYNSIQGSVDQSLPHDSVAEFIAYTLGPKSSSQAHLTQLIGSVKSFVQPANSGPYTQVIGKVVGLVAENVVQRLIRERYRPHKWLPATPDEHKLTDDCVTRFVESIRPFAFAELFSRVKATEVGFLFNQLAELRPELIIPEVLDRVYSTLDSLTEPRKLTAALQCLTNVSRALVTGHNGYTAGRTHVIPILFAVLPGIDPNDFRKTAITLDFLTSFALLVPLVDCSRAGEFYTDLTDEERLICDQSAEFETFVLQYLDRVFAVIEASAHLHTRMEQAEAAAQRSKLELMADASLMGSTQGILGQCSPAIIAAAQQKLCDFVRTNQFETSVAAPMVGSLVVVAARQPSTEDYVQRVFFPWLIGAINGYVEEHEDAAGAEKQSEELLYYLQLLESFAQGNAERVLSSHVEIVGVFDRVRNWRCVRAQRKAHAIVCHMLRTISGLQSMDVRSSPDSFRLPLSECLPIRRWGEKSQQPVSWYVPDERARVVGEQVIHRYVPEYIERFDKFARGEDEGLSREELDRDTKAMVALLQCAPFLPNWADDEVALQAFDECCTNYEELVRVRVTLGAEHLVVRMPDGGNVRRALVGALGRLQEKMLRDREDDFKTLENLAYLWEFLHWKRHSFGRYKAKRNNHRSKKMFQNTALCRRPLNIRAVTCAEIIIQHECREHESWPPLTATTLTVVRHLLAVSVSKYAGVRKVAQERLGSVINKYPRAYRLILDDLLELLRTDPNAEHKRFKGTLFVVLVMYGNGLLLTNDLPTLAQLWPALLRTNLSEKPTTLQLLDMITATIGQAFMTMQVGVEMPDKSVQLALALCPSEPITADQIAAGELRSRQTGAANLAALLQLQRDILQIVHERQLHWRYEHIASTMLNALAHPIAPYPLEVVRYAMHNLIHDAVAERNMAVAIMRSVMAQQKREFEKRPLDTKSLEIWQPSDRRDLWTSAPGARPDNRFLQYDLAKAPRSQAEWDEPRFVHKTMGFFGWQTDFGVYDIDAKQPKPTREPSELSEIERIIYDFVCDEASLAKLIEFWSLEERRGAEQFHRSRMCLAKSWVTQFGRPVAERLMAHAERLVAIQVTANVEANHRCAAELVGGVVRGVKHWPFEETKQIYEERLVPLVRQVLGSITSETDGVWGTCMATAVEHMAPQRQWWLHEVLLEEPLREERSNVNCTRLYCLQGAYNQHVWRMNSVSHRLLEYVRPFLDHPFQNVRNRIGSLLINIFEADMEFANANAPECPRIGDFIDELLPRLECLYDDAAYELDTTTQSSSVASMESVHTGDGDVEMKEVTDVADKVEPAKMAEYKAAIRLFKVAGHWITGIMNRCTNGNRAAYFKLLPLACHLAHTKNDEELTENCNSLLAIIAQALTTAEVMPVALDTIEAITHRPKWTARSTVLGVLQILVFNNLPVVLADPRLVQQVQEMVLRLMTDRIVEVRQKAFGVLSGMLHCSFLPDTDKLLEMFKSKSRTKVPKMKRGGNGTQLPPAMPAPVAPLAAAAVAAASEDVADVLDDAGQVIPNETEPMRQRLMGVMGLCAFIGAHPYEVPDFVPDVIEALGPHLNAPEVISATIRKTIRDFKRTHHDDWTMHKQKFTENQLAVLSDLTSPPSYYA